uniref:Uncharacterized protein n=1 Tax=Octopus bimaculoides TaxID=37653 RepID=A0A0L8FRU2_OCTBM
MSYFLFHTFISSLFRHIRSDCFAIAFSQGSCFSIIFSLLIVHFLKITLFYLVTSFILVIHSLFKTVIDFQMKFFWQQKLVF